MNRFKIIVKSIVNKYGGDINSDELFLDIDSGQDHVEDLNIEGNGDKLVVCQYYTQDGNLIRDPQVKFDISEEGWTAVEYRDDPHTHKFDSSGLSIDTILSRWATNMEKQFL